MEGTKCSRVTKKKEARKGGIKDRLEGWSSCEERAFISSSLLRFLLFLLLTVCDDVADVLVVNVASHIWGEGGPQVLHLRERGGNYIYRMEMCILIKRENRLV